MLTMFDDELPYLFSGASFTSVYLYNTCQDILEFVGRGFDTPWGEFLNLPNPSGRTRPCGLLSL
jgi:hypothetical protein